MKSDTTTRREERKVIIEQISKNDNPVFAIKGAARILNTVVEDLEDSINRNSEQSGKLATVMVWLTYIIAFGTILLAIIGGADLYFKIKFIQHVHEATNISTELKK